MTGTLISLPKRASMVDMKQLRQADRAKTKRSADAVVSMHVGDVMHGRRQYAPSSPASGTFPSSRAKLAKFTCSHLHLCDIFRFCNRRRRYCSVPRLPCHTLPAALPEQPSRAAPQRRLPWQHWPRGLWRLRKLRRIRVLRIAMTRWLRHPPMLFTSTPQMAILSHCSCNLCACGVTRRCGCVLQHL